MLDDLKQIHFADKSDALGIAEKQWQQLEHEFDIPEANFEIENIVFAGMGGSALAARLSLTWPCYHVPFEINLDYDIPKYVSDKTLFIASSYSGNTEEVLSALEQAEQVKARIIIIASGGKLEQIAKQNNHVFVKLPDASQPRFGVLYSFKALVTILERTGFVKTQSAEKAIHETAGHLKKAIEGWIPTVATKDNLAKQIALDIVGTSPVIYAGPMLFPAAYKWKISFNETAKNVAWTNQYSEFNHNEFMGWVSQPIDKPYSIIDLRTNLEHPQIKKRFDISAKLLSGKRPHPITVEAQGKDILQQMLWTVALGDFVSLYLAVLNGVDPTQVDLMEKLKKEL